MATDQQFFIDIYRAFNARDIEQILSRMHPDVDWPNGMEGGRMLGQQAVREYWTRQFGMINPNVQPVDFSTAEDGRTIIKVHQVVHDLDGNLLVDGMVEHIYLIEDGLVRSMEIRDHNDVSLKDVVK